MTHPAQTARDHLVKALDACQLAEAESAAFASLTACLAKAQGKLFEATKVQIEDSSCRNLLRGAMDYLAQALKLLQDIDVKAEPGQVAAESVAAVLKILHPLVHPTAPSKSEEGAQEQPGIEPGGVRDTFDVHVQTQLSMSTDHNFYLSFSENIEEGGIFVATFEPKPIDSKVIVRFKLPGDHRVAARGVVQWVREYNQLHPDTAPGMGVRFTELDPEDRSAIEEYLGRREPMFYDDL